MKLLKEINKVGEKTYTNYILEIPVGDKTYKVGIQPKTFGRDWTHPMVRQSFTILDIASQLVVKENKENE